MSSQYSHSKNQCTSTQNELDLLDQSINRVEKKVSILEQMLYRYENATANA